jgi:hypothetical protein
MEKGGPCAADASLFHSVLIAFWWLCTLEHPWQFLILLVVVGLLPLTASGGFLSKKKVALSTCFP